MKTILNLSNTKDLCTSFFGLKSRSDIANLLEISEQTLIYYVYRLPKDIQYKNFAIHKRRNGDRIISAPITPIKIIQRKLNSILQLIYEPRTSAYGFRKLKNIKMNAQQHINSQLVLNIDLKDFFDQIHFGRIKGAFRSTPFNFNEEVSSTLANICVLDGKLPQGAPTSPVISNIVCWSLDKYLEKFTKKYRGCKYTRYADDITISTKNSVFPPEIVKKVTDKVLLGDELLETFTRCQFQLNTEKTRISRIDKRQLVTGLIVNQFVNVKREYIRTIRKNLFIWEKFGINALQNKLSYKIDLSPYKSITNPTWSLSGQINFLAQIRGIENEQYKKVWRWFNYLKLRDDYYRLSKTTNYTERGLGLEDILNSLCKVNSIECREPFVRSTDQIDGAIFLKNQVILVECKWTNDNDIINRQIDIFQNKVTQRSGQDSYGIFISIAEWNQNAITNLKIARDKNIILMSKEDLEIILNNRSINLEKILETKIRYLITNADSYLAVREIRKQ